MANFSKPILSDPNDQVLDSLRENINASLTGLKGVTNPLNLPQYAVKLDNGVLQRWNGSAWLGENIQIQSGGTGASTAAGARTNLSVYSKAEINALESAVQSQIDSNDTDISNIQTNITTLQNKTVDATTTNKGIVQLNNTLTSTSTTQALTAAQGKVLNDSILSSSGNVTEINMSGVGSFTGGTLYVHKIGRHVTVAWTSLTHNSTQFPNASGIIPVGSRPSTSTYNRHVPDALVEVRSDGGLFISKSSSDTTTEGGSVVYIV